MEGFEKSSVGHTDDLQQKFDRIMEIEDIWERAIEMKEFLAFCEEEISKCDRALTKMEMEDGEVRIEYVPELSGDSPRGKILQRRECFTDEAKVIRNAIRWEIKLVTDEYDEILVTLTEEVTEDFIKSVDEATAVIEELNNQN